MQFIMTQTQLFIFNLAQWENTNELKGDYINEFRLAETKKCAYWTFKGEKMCKVQGFTLNYTKTMDVMSCTKEDVNPDTSRGASVIKG